MSLYEPIFQSRLELVRLYGAPTPCKFRADAQGSGLPGWWGRAPLGRNPIIECCRRAGDAFDALSAQVESDVAAGLERFTISPANVDWEAEGVSGPSSTWTCLVDDRAVGTVRSEHPETTRP